jgi:hypothetical protein
MLRHEWGNPRTSGGAAARDRRNPETEFSVLADAQTGLYGDGCSRETRAKAEGNYEGIEIHDCVEKTLKTGWMNSRALAAGAYAKGQEKAELEVRLEWRFPLCSKQGER